MTDQHLAQAAELAPLIERVHGERHPELTRVRELTLALQQHDGSTPATELFTQLRAVTENYAIPEDACEAFEATYQALARADQQHALA